MEPRNVLIFPGGTEIGLEIWRALRNCKEVRLFSAGVGGSSHAPYVFQHHFSIPSVYEKDWLSNLIEIVKMYDIKYIFPAHDDVIVALANNLEYIPCTVISSPPYICQITRSKTKTYASLRSFIPVPNQYFSIPEIEDYPIFLKPDKGQGSLNAYRVDNEISLKSQISQHSDMIMLEYLPGKEYTVDCFSDKGKGLLYSGARERIRTKNGISMDSKLANNTVNEIGGTYARKIMEIMDLRGAWFFQMKEDAKGLLKIMEIAPRISGTMAANRVRGVNFPLLSIFEREGLDIEIMTNNYDVEVDRALINRYRTDITYSHIYVDLDDTLVVRDGVNIELVSFLYQSANKGKRISLITKTVQCLDDYLTNFRLKGLFNEIIVIKKEENKADFINPNGAIFIDDSYKERLSVHARWGIPTFDCSMIEVLLDDKI
jgi:carbamoyl-phosphate synthase large subunit